jgi:hypothetical protein
VIESCVDILVDDARVDFEQWTKTKVKSDKLQYFEFSQFTIAHSSAANHPQQTCS